MVPGMIALLGTPRRLYRGLDGYRNDTVQRSGDHDLIFTTGGGQDQTTVLNVDVGVVAGVQLKGLDRVEIEGTHGAKAVCSSV